MKQVCVWGECEHAVQEAVEQLQIKGWKTKPVKITSSPPPVFCQTLYMLVDQENSIEEGVVESGLRDVLSRAPHPRGSASVVNEQTDFVTMVELFFALGIDVGKSSPSLESLIRGWLAREGWSPVKKMVNGVPLRGYQKSTRDQE